MASDLKIEIFAYKWFQRILLSTDLLSCNYDVTEVYKDECLAYPECYESSDCDHLYYAIMFRRWLFEKFYLEEIQTQINEFRHSLIDFYCYVLRTCNRVDLFGNLTLFERVFATCAFVCCLCVYCCENDYSEIMIYGHICWAMYFDQIADEFYKQGGWNHLKMVAVSYKLPIDFVDIVQVEERADITLIKINKAIRSYRRFKLIRGINHDECISMLWVKFYTQRIMENSDNDFFEEFYFNNPKNYTEVENTLRQLKYLCDPNASKILEFLCRISATDSLEVSMANLNICDKNVNLESKEKTVLESKQNKASLNLVAKSSENLVNAEAENVLACREPDKSTTCLKVSPTHNNLTKIGRNHITDGQIKSDYQLKIHERDTKTAPVEQLLESMTISKWKGEKEVNKNAILNEQMPFTEDRGDDKTKTQNTITNEQGEWNVKGTKRSTSLSRWITPTGKNTEERSSYEAQNDTRKKEEQRKSATKSTILTKVKKREMKNNKEIPNAARNEYDECKVTKKKKKRGNKKENSIKNQDDIRKEQNESKDKEGTDNAIVTGKISSIEKNSRKERTEDEKKCRNGARKEQEDCEVRKFLRMLLVLGDKEGISYVQKTS